MDWHHSHRLGSALESWGCPESLAPQRSLSDLAFRCPFLSAVSSLNQSQPPDTAPFLPVPQHNLNTSSTVDGAFAHLKLKSLRREIRSPEAGADAGLPLGVVAALL